MVSVTMREPTLAQMRAESLAVVYLTRRDDVHVTAHPTGVSGVDLLVSLLQEGNDTGRYLGIEVKASASAPLSRSVIAAQAERLADVPFPICLFAFTMEDDKAYWTWLREPLADSTNALVTNSEATVSALTNDIIENIVRRVNSWYDLQGNVSRIA